MQRDAEVAGGDNIFLAEKACMCLHRCFNLDSSLRGGAVSSIISTADEQGVLPQVIGLLRRDGCMCEIADVPGMKSVIDRYKGEEIPECLSLRHDLFDISTLISKHQRNFKEGAPKRKFVHKCLGIPSSIAEMLFSCDKYGTVSEEDKIMVSAMKADMEKSISIEKIHKYVGILLETFSPYLKPELSGALKRSHKRISSEYKRICQCSCS